MDRSFPKTNNKEQYPLDIEKILRDIRKAEQSSKINYSVSQTSKAQNKKYAAQSSMSISEGSADEYYSSEFDDEEGSDTASSRKRDDDGYADSKSRDSYASW